MYDIEKLNNKKVNELREIAEKLNISKADKLKKQELVYKILDEQALKPSSDNDKKETTNPQLEASNTIAKKPERATEPRKKPVHSKEIKIETTKEIRIEITKEIINVRIMNTILQELLLAKVF